MSLREATVFCRAVAIPRKGSIRLQSSLCNTKYQTKGAFPGDVSTAPTAWLNKTELYVCFILCVSIIDALDHEGWVVGEGCCGGIAPSGDGENTNKVFTTPPHLSLRDTFSPRAKAFMAVQNTYCVPPKLVHLKLSSKLQTVSKHYQGWRGVTLQRHLNEGAAG